MKNARLSAQLKQRFSSEILWHFCGKRQSEEQRYHTLVSILKNGLKLGEKKEEFKYWNAITEKQVTLWGYPVACLADIPLKDLHIHAERYGQYAIGFHKENAIDNHFNPVMYVNQYSRFFHRFMQLRDELESHVDKMDPEIGKKFSELLYLLGSVAKSGNLKANPSDNIKWDELQVNNFYYEREWRAVREWNFSKNDVALIVIPDEKIADFMKDKKSGQLRMDEHTPILPFSMIYRL